MLPFFLIVYAGIFYMHSHYMGRQQALLRARSCTWSYAAAGCPDKEELRKCLAPSTFTLGEVSQSGPDEEGAGPPPVETAGVGTTQVGSDLGGRLDKLKKVPLLGGVITWLFGEPVSATAIQLVQIHESLISRAERKPLKAHYYMMCNTAPKNWEDTAKRIFCGFVGDLKIFGCPP